MRWSGFRGCPSANTRAARDFFTSRAGRAVSAMCLVVTTATACRQAQLGPCETVFEDPLLTIASAKDRITLRSVQVVGLADFSFGGAVVRDLRFLTQTGGPVGGVTAAGTTLACTVSCFFAAAEGQYSMKVSAPGYRDTTIAVNAAYATRDRSNGGCPLRLSKGVSIDLFLAPE